VTDDRDRTPSERADVCVVGSGPAGALVAHTLADRGYDVVVLEAGEDFDRSERERRMEESIRPAYDEPELWNMGGERDEYTSSGDRFYPLNISRVKGLGGSTLHWQGMVMRLHEKDFEMETRHGIGDDWPIEYEDLKPYYARAEKEMGVAGGEDNPFKPPRDEPFPLPAFERSHSDEIFEEACDELGIETHSVPNARNSEPYDGRSDCVGYGTCQPVCPSGAKYSADVHIRKAQKEGARIIDRAQVQRLLHDSSGQTIEKALYTVPNGETHEQEARVFVVACGGIETPRLLLLSKSEEYPDGLANTSGTVGRYFTEHLFAGAGGIIDEPTRQNHVGFNTSETHQFYDGTEPTPVGVKIEFLNYAGPSPVETALNADDWGDSLFESLRDEYGRHLGVGALIEQVPKKENQISLDASKTDSLGNPVPDVRWSIGERTKHTIEEVNRIQNGILDELEPTDRWTVGPDGTGPAYHHMGTTRMGEDPDESVVNKRLRTHDIDNLYVASSSVFVTGGAMNPTLTIGAIALKTADHIDKKL